MTDIFYDVEAGAVVTPSGAAVSRVPELFYQEHTAWRLALKRGSTAADISGVAAWGAAVAADFCAGTAPMCRTLAENITADVATGAVTVALDCATGDFFAAVNGCAVKPAWFELYGIDAEGRRIVEVCFEIRARMTLDPDPAVDTSTPETVATKTYTQLAISGAIAARGLVDGSGARIEAAGVVSAHDAASTAHASAFKATVKHVSELPVNISEYLNGPLFLYTGEAGEHLPGHIYRAVQIDGAFSWRDLTPAISGAIVSGQDFDTVIGSARITATSGGVLVSAGGAVVSVTSGAIFATGANGESMALSGGQIAARNAEGGGFITSDGSVLISDGYGGEIAVTAGNVTLGGGGDIMANGSPVLTELVTSPDSESTSAIFEVLEGGTSYIYTQPLTSIGIASITSDCRARFKFTAGSGFDLTLPNGADVAGTRTYETGSHYVLAIDGGMVVIAPYAILGEGE